MDSLARSAVLNELDDAIVGCDANHTITVWSGGAERLYGWLRVDAMGRDIRGLLRTAFPERTPEEVHALLLHYGRFRGICAQKRRDGSDLTVETSITRLRSPEGAFAGYVAVNRDCSVAVENERSLRRALEEVQKAEHDRAESEARLKAMMNAFEGLIYVCSEDLRVEFMNDRFIQRTGRNAVGEPCYKALHNRADKCPWCVTDRVMKGETVRWEVQSPLDQRWYYIVNTPLRHADGRISKQALILDITDRKAAEARLAANQSVLEAMLDANQDAICLLDSHMRITRANATMNRWFPREGGLTGCVCGQVLAHPEAVCANCPARRAMKNNRSESELLTLRAPDGGDLYLEARAFPLHSTSSTPDGALLVLRDVTQRENDNHRLRDLEIRLARADKRDSLFRMAAGIAHDFNNLLQIIIGNIELAQDAAPQPAADALNAAQAAATRAATLSRLMLTYTGQIITRPVAVDINGWLQDIQPELRRVVQPEVEIELLFSHGLPIVAIDSDQMQQAILHIVRNAAESMHGQPRGRITVATGLRELTEADIRSGPLDIQTPGSFVEISIVDNGCGMDAVTQQRLFEPFFTTKFLGRGLGLPAVLGIISAHQGVIRVTSSPGRGTTFSLCIPFASSRVPHTAPPPRIAARERQPTILVVDDEVGIRDLVRVTLETEGFSVALAEHGDAAMEALEQRGGAVSLVLLDLRMPGRPGEEVFAEIRRRWPLIPVLIFTGYSERDAAKWFSDSQPDGFVTKPLDVASLRERVRALVATRG